MSFLIHTDLLSLLERKQVPAKLIFPDPAFLRAPYVALPENALRR